MNLEQTFAPAPLPPFPRKTRRNMLALGIGRTLAAWRAIWARQARLEKQAALSSISRALGKAHDERSRIVVP